MNQGAQTGTVKPNAVERTLIEFFRLRADASLVNTDDGEVWLRQSRFQLVLSDLTVGRRAMVHRLAEGWSSDLDLSSAVASIEGQHKVLQAQLLLRRLVSHSWLTRRFVDGDRPMIEIIPQALGIGTMPTTERHRPGMSYRVSRFALLRNDGGILVAETPRSPVSVGILDPRLTATLAQCCTAMDAETLATSTGLGPLAVGRLLDQLITSGILVDDDVARDEANAMPLAAWSPYDLMLHERSRAGRHVLPLGGTYPLRSVTTSPPLVRRHENTDRVPLDEPDMEVTAKSDGTLTEVVDARQSVREHDLKYPISAEALGEFLYRVQRLHRMDGSDQECQELGRRPYPAGGSVAELEVYPVVTSCAGLDPGVYHYDSAEHELVRLADLTTGGTRVVRFAQSAVGMTTTPQVCLVVTARVERMMWKYQGMGYSMVLKHAGVLTELMYLVATAMGLAPCAVGTGDSAAFEMAAGVDGLAEPSVAEFILGARETT